MTHSKPELLIPGFYQSLQPRQRRLPVHAELATAEAAAEVAAAAAAATSGARLAAQDRMRRLAARGDQLAQQLQDLQVALLYAIAARFLRAFCGVGARDRWGPVTGHQRPEAQWRSIALSLTTKF